MTKKIAVDENNIYLSGKKISLSDLINKLYNDSKILWANPSPNLEFASQQITLNSSDYDELIWFYVHYASSNTILSQISIKGFGTFISVPNSQGVSARRQITRNSDTRFMVGAVEGSTTDISNLVPLYVIGKKTGLFN